MLRKLLDLFSGRRGVTPASPWRRGEEVEGDRIAPGYPPELDVDLNPAGEEREREERSE